MRNKRIKDNVKAIVDFINHMRLYPIYQIKKIEKILKKYFCEAVKK